MRRLWLVGEKRYSSTPPAYRALHGFRYREILSFLVGKMWGKRAVFASGVWAPLDSRGLSSYTPPITCVRRGA
jgi:hypothetical protein